MTSVKAPPGFGSIEGAGNYFDFGSWANGRLMLLDGEMRGSARALKAVELRLDHRRYVNGAQGRWWRNLAIDVSHCDIDKASATFSQNPVTTPTRVFSASVALPTQRGLPAELPAAWGGPKGRMRYPFRSAFPYDGKRDLCMDADFTGGEFYNRQP